MDKPKTTDDLFAYVDKYIEMAGNDELIRDLVDLLRHPNVKMMCVHDDEPDVGRPILEEHKMLIAVALMQANRQMNDLSTPKGGHKH